MHGLTPYRTLTPPALPSPTWRERVRAWWRLDPAAVVANALALALNVGFVALNVALWLFHGARPLLATAAFCAAMMAITLRDARRACERALGRGDAAKLARGAR